MASTERYEIRPYNPVLLSERMGRALVINNKKYPGDRFRRGSEKDVENIKDLLEYLNFDVAIREDLKTNEILEEVKDFLHHLKYVEVDMVTLVLMGHGHGSKDCIEGIDEGEVEFEDIFNEFTNRNCPELMNKPKLFIIQTCRGDKQDSGFRDERMYCTTDGGGGSKLDNINLSPSVLKDYLIAFSTIDNYASYRSDSGNLCIYFRQ